MSKGANDNNNGMSGRSVGGRAITRKAMLCIVGAFLFIFGTLFERHLWTQRTKGKDLSSDSKDRSERVTAKRPSTPSLSLSLSSNRTTADAAAKRQQNAVCSIYLCIQTKDPNKFAFTDDALRGAIEKEANRLSNVVNVNVDALGHTMKKCVKHPNDEWEIPKLKRANYLSHTNKMEDLKTSLYKGIPLFPIVVHQVIWQVTDAVGNDRKTIPAFPENSLVSLRDLEKPKIDEKYRQKIESIMQTAKYWIDEAYALYEDDGGRGNLPLKYNDRKVWAIWSGLNGSNYAYRLVAAKLGVGLASFENALAWRLVVDVTTGVASSKGSEKSFYWKYKDLVDKNVAMQEAIAYKNKILDQKWNKNIDKWDMHLSPSHNLPPDILERPARRPMVVFLGHVYSDTSVVYMLENGFNDQVDVIIETASWCVKHNVDFVVKMHPAEKKAFLKKSPTETKLKLDPRWQALLALKDSNPLTAKKNMLLKVDGQNLVNTYKLIDAADVIVTVLSSSGFESLLLGKQVILTGAAFYGKLGFTRDAQTSNELRSHLYSVLQKRLSKTRRAGKTDVALTPSLYEDVATFFYTFRHYATVDRNDVDEIARRIIRACTPAV